ncbi:hypothetical protein BHM03_00037752 [Ensete ventricosum]|nr:hypothetical protein BHM03_00037752 [Ensete ventricosum]
MAMFRLSSIISGLDKLASYITSSSSSSCDPCGRDELVELKDSVVRTRNYVMDSRGVIGDASVKLWLMELDNLVHLIDRILVESASEQQPQLVTCRKRAKLEKKEPAPDVINFLQVQEEIRKRFHEMSADWAAIHLTETDVGMRFQQQRSSSPSGFQIDESCVFGRDDDKNKVIELLFSDDSKRGNVSIISIVGVAGIGKTTLAQLAYNDPKICAHFTARGWVCLSRDIDAVGLLQAIVQSVTGKACRDKDLVTLERTLEGVLKGTKFLLVLDDVREEEEEEDCLWDCLWSPLLGAETTKIVVTTRNELVSNSIQELVLPHHLSSLSEANCWSLFRRFAFDGEDPNEHPNLVEIGRRIAAMCRGWPLAAKTLGVLLRFETDEDMWLDILQGEVLGLVGSLNLTLQPSSDGAVEHR